MSSFSLLYLCLSLGLALVLALIRSLVEESYIHDQRQACTKQSTGDSRDGLGHARGHPVCGGNPGGDDSGEAVSGPVNGSPGEGLDLAML